jgi:hypothetical protein
VFALPDGAIGLAIGDVMGHDLAAAAAMGQLRSVLRSYAYEGSSPSVVLDRLDRLVQDFEMAQLATAVYGRLVLDDRPATSTGTATSGPTGGAAMLLFTNARVRHRPDRLARPTTAGAQPPPRSASGHMSRSWRRDLGRTSCASARSWARSTGRIDPGGRLKRGRAAVEASGHC